MTTTPKILCDVTEISEGNSKGFSLHNTPGIQDIFIVNRDNQFYAYENHCPHTGVSLNWQPDVFMDMENFYIQCSVHGAKFNVEDGLCVWGPCVKQSLKAVTIEIQGTKIVFRGAE